MVGRQNRQQQRIVDHTQGTSPRRWQTALWTQLTPCHGQLVPRVSLLTNSALSDEIAVIAVDRGIPSGRTFGIARRVTWLPSGPGEVPDKRFVFAALVSLSKSVILSIVPH